jgi:hypothetical protein
MIGPLKIAVLALALSAAGVQASPNTVATLAPPLVGGPSGKMTYEMTSAFGNAVHGGSLHSAVYDNGHDGATIYYQITNNASSANSIQGINTDLENAPPDSADWGLWKGQVAEGFGSFVQGTEKSKGSYGQIWGGANGETVRVTEYFGEHGTGDAPLMSSGIGPGESSYIGTIWANDGHLGGSVQYGSITIDGYEADCFVSAIPEPEEYALMLAGLGLIGSIARRRKTQAA